MKSEPERILLELCNFLQHVPSPQQLQNALLLIKETNDDLCFLHKNVKTETCPSNDNVEQIRPGAIPITRRRSMNEEADFMQFMLPKIPCIPSREKTKKKRNKR